MADEREWGVLVLSTGADTTGPGILSVATMQEWSLLLAPLCLFSTGFPTD
jgi:hypothetical protein